MNLRMIGLATVVVLTTLLPLAASAVPVPGPVSEPLPGPLSAPAALLADEAKAGPLLAASAKSAEPVEDTGSRTAEVCGPEVTSPEGIEAQTCVLSEGHDTWARTYYRNATRAELLAVLSLMGPAGRTVQTHCAVSADAEPLSCETRREPSRGAPARYMAVAEFAADDGSGSGNGQLRLRSGSGSTSDPDPGYEANSGAPAVR